MKRIILSAVVGLALGAGSATAEITPVGEPFLDTSKSTLLLQEYEQGAQVTYLSDFCNPLVPHLAKVFGDSRGAAWVTCLRTINAINEETPGWRNPDSIDSGQRMLLISPLNFEEPHLSDLKERVAEIGKVNNLANDPRAMAAMLIAMSNRGAVKLNDEQMQQLADDLEAAAVAVVKEIPKSAQFLGMVQDAVNKNLAARSETPVTVDLSGIESVIQANKDAIQANKDAIASLPTAEVIAADAAKLVQLSDADKADIAAQVPVPAAPTAAQVASEFDTNAIAQEASKLVKLPEVEALWWQTSWAYGALVFGLFGSLFLINRLYSRSNVQDQRIAGLEVFQVARASNGRFEIYQSQIDQARNGDSFVLPALNKSIPEYRVAIVMTVHKLGSERKFTFKGLERGKDVVHGAFVAPALRHLLKAEKEGWVTATEPFDEVEIAVPSKKRPVFSSKNMKNAIRSFGGSHTPATT